MTPTHQDNTIVDKMMKFDYDESSIDDSDWEPIVDDTSGSSEDELSEDELSEGLYDSHSHSELLSAYRSGGYGEASEQQSPLKRSTSLVARSTKAFLILLPLLLLLLCSHYPFPTVDFDGAESIYVPGVGFSGFWFTLGRLKSIQDPASKHFVCFSAGCLGAVTILNDFTVDEMACMAQTAQTAWKSGAISRFQVVSQFVDGLVYRNFPRQDDPLGCLGSLRDAHNTSHVPINNPLLLSKLHILTSETTGTLGVRSSMRSPTNLEELREMLLQTAWIPLATGNGWTHNGHLDGGFTLWQHPKCTKSVNLPLDLRLFANSLNVNMGREEAFRLWNDGLAYGL